MAPKKSNTSLSSSGKVVYAVTNYVAFMEKESVHADFHLLMDFLKISPISYALTASPTIYAEIVQEMWSKADCTRKGEIKFTIKGNSYTLTPSVINEALHLPNSNFEKLPTDEEIICMLKFINYASKSWLLSPVSRRYLRKEWSYFFDTLTRVFTGRCGCYNTITTFILKIAYSLMYGRTINLGALLLNEFSIKLGNIEDRDEVIYYARFLMIIANYLCKELSLKNRDDTLQVCVQRKRLFTQLVMKNLYPEVEFVLPQHVRVQLSRLSSSPSYTSSSLVTPTLEDMREKSTPTQIAILPQSHSGRKASSSVSQSGRRKKATLPTMSEHGSEENETEVETHSPQKKKNAREVKCARGLCVVNHESPIKETRDGMPLVEPLSSEEEKSKHSLLFLPEPALKPEDRQHLLNAAAVFKSQLVTRLTSYADKLSFEDMIILADECYNTLEDLGDDYTSFSFEVNKLIARHQELAFAAKKKENWNEWDIKARYIYQVQLLSEVRQKLFSAESKLSTAKTNAFSLKLEREEMTSALPKLTAETNADYLKPEREGLTSALIKLTEELYVEEYRIKTLTVERDQCHEARSAIEAELLKLEAGKEEAHVAFKVISDQYDAAKKEFERMSNHILLLVRK